MVECTGLENQRWATVPGFESLPLRHFPLNILFSLALILVSRSWLSFTIFLQASLIVLAYPLFLVYILIAQRLSSFVGLVGFQ